MAGLLWSVRPRVEVACVAATLKSVLRIKAAAGAGLEVTEIAVQFDGILPTNEPVIVELLRQSTDGTFTAISTTYSSTNGQIAVLNDVSWAAGFTAGYNCSSEPTVSAALPGWEIHPQSGIDILLPLKQEIIVPAGGRLALAITAPANVNCMPTMKGWE